MATIIILTWTQYMLGLSSFLCSWSCPFVHEWNVFENDLIIKKLCLYFVCQHILVKFSLHEILKKNKVKLLPKIWKRLKFLLHFINEAKGKLEIVIESHGYWIRVSISCQKCGEPWYYMFDHNSSKRDGRLQIQEHFELLVRS